MTPPTPPETTLRSAAEKARDYLGPKAPSDKFGDEIYDVWEALESALSATAESEPEVERVKFQGPDVCPGCLRLRKEAAALLREG